MPKPDGTLYPWERAELNGAQRRYESALNHRSRLRNDPGKRFARLALKLVRVSAHDSRETKHHKRAPNHSRIENILA